MVWAYRGMLLGTSDLIDDPGVLAVTGGTAGPSLAVVGADADLPASFSLANGEQRSFTVRVAGTGIDGQSRKQRLHVCDITSGKLLRWT